MADYRTANARNVSSQERDASLLQTIIAFLRFAQRPVDVRNGRLKCSKLD